MLIFFYLIHSFSIIFFFITFLVSLRKGYPRLLESCSSYVTAKQSNLSHWHPVLGNTFKKLHALKKHFRGVYCSFDLESLAPQARFIKLSKILTNFYGGGGIRHFIQPCEALRNCSVSLICNRGVCYTNYNNMKPSAFKWII